MTFFIGQFPTLSTADSGSRVPRPNSVVQKSQWLAAGCDRQGRMNQQSNALGAMANRPQALGARMSRIVQGRSILHSQNNRMQTHPLQRCFMVRLADSGSYNSLIFHEPIGCFNFRQITASLRNSSGGLLSKCRGDHLQSFGVSFISQGSMSKLMCGPSGGSLLI